MIFSGGTPNFSTTPAGPMRRFFMVSSSCTRSVTSWAMSLSPVTISTVSPRASPSLASVPITSSASTSGSISSGRPSPRISSSTAGNCRLRSSGVSLRLALYSG